MNLFKIDIKKYLQIGAILLAFVMSIAFSHERQHILKTKSVEVLIDNNYTNYFVEQSEVTELINGSEKDYITGTPLTDIELRRLEKNVEKHPYVQKADIYRDLQGVLSVEVKQKKPFARLFKRNGTDFYITETGELIPESDKYTARVLILEMENGGMIGNKNMDETEYGIRLFDLLKKISTDELWKSQIAGIFIDRDGEIVIQPQITKQRIEFGQPDNINAKFNKLRIFYQQILPARGWNIYARVNVKYEKQIICE
ncbi:MAG: hypothetical protein O2887_11465 [Bacteroidetes bacterium]|nr:hypothetical protein [Bacteroidota bacterium]MDA1121089.1 hypothetical protein [Bacteroidota bacterium]